MVAIFFEISSGSLTQLTGDIRYYTKNSSASQVCGFQLIQMVLWALKTIGCILYYILGGIAIVIVPINIRITRAQCKVVSPHFTLVTSLGMLVYWLPFLPAPMKPFPLLI